MARTLFQVDRMLTDEQVASLYALATKYKIAICLYQNTPLPSTGSSEWAASGRVWNLLPFLRHVYKNQF